MFLQSLRTDRYSVRHSSFPYFLNAAVFVKGAQKVKPGANSIAVWVPLCWLNPVCHPWHESKSPCKPTASSASTARNQSTPQPTRPGAPAPSGEHPCPKRRSNTPQARRLKPEQHGQPNHHQVQQNKPTRTCADWKQTPGLLRLPIETKPSPTTPARAQN